ncbi:MAG: nucleoside hydrolase, partial [Armatimonadota bacterium]|nr:nucleoside hydrolase [Armatimonadota bacterium]
MINNPFALACVVGSLLAAQVVPVPCAQAASDGRPVPVIFDTDMSGDCDDAGSLAVLNSFMNQGEAALLACVVNGRDQDASSGAAIYAINAYYGRPNIPVGAYQGTATATKSPYTLAVRQKFGPDFPLDTQLRPGVKVYRRALAKAKHHSVVIVSVGFMQNLQDLLQSKPDKLSKLNGTDLVKDKVKELVVMGGGFPASGNGSEYNFGFGGVGPVTAYTIENWPGRILFTGFEIGASISTGKALAATPEQNPVRFIYSLYGDHPSALEGGRPSWDITAAWLAVRGPAGVWDLVEGGYCHVLPDGHDQWMTDHVSDQAY